MKLGQTTIDTYSGNKVTPITLWVLNKDGTNRRICCQPYGLNPETGQPVDVVWFSEDRLKDGAVEGELPCHLIGEEAEDTATGFKGVITAVVLHINGCIHAEIQPKGRTKTGSLVGESNFDIRRLKGKNIPKYTEAALEKSYKSHPSPAHTGRPNH